MIRATEKGQEIRSQRLAAMRKKLSDVKNLDSMRGTSEWKSLKSLLQGFVESEESAIKSGVISCAMGGYYSVEEQGIKPVPNDRLVSDLRVAHERKSAFELVIDLVEKTDEQIEHLNANIKNIEDKFKEAKEQLS